MRVTEAQKMRCEGVKCELLDGSESDLGPGWFAVVYSSPVECVLEDVVLLSNTKAMRTLRACVRFGSVGEWEM
jgi:hypothetical protein